MFYRITESLRRFMQGRHGVDQLSLAMLITAMFFSLLFSLLRWNILSILYWIVIFLCFFRILSRNLEKRYSENQKFLCFWQPVKDKLSRLPGDMEQRKTHCLFKCPHCKQKLRLPRGRGTVMVTCSRCHTEFKKKT